MIGKNSCYLESIRTYELKLAMSYIPGGARILEIGAGAGWQAKLLSDYGYRVDAIDVEESRYLSQAVFPVKVYDGYKIPFDDKEFDVVFSSNVLEHIPDLVDFQKEIRRVLRPGGLVVHVLPTSAWRLWTSLTHYIYIFKLIGHTIRKNSFPPLSRLKQHQEVDKKKLLPVEILTKVIWPNRHGERGNSISELYLFSRSGWKALFRKTGWYIEHLQPTGLFYTGNTVFGNKISFRLRKRLALMLDSSTAIYCLRDSI